jgi:hypothetical protein
MTTANPVHAGRFELAGNEVQLLRSRYLADNTAESAVVSSRIDGWLTVNRRFLEEQRALGERSMRELMDTLGITEVETAEEALDLVNFAVHVFTPGEGYQGSTVRMSSSELRIINPYCPIYAAMEERNWRGVTACPSWHMRRGWLDALNVEATDSVVAEKKWGDPACAAVIRVGASPVTNS